MSGQGRIGQRRSNGHGLRHPHSALARYQLDGEVLQNGLAIPPFVSINYGAAGIAYAIYRIARSQGDRQWLTSAAAWVQKAFELSTNAKAFYDPDMGLTPEAVGEVSLFHSVSGLHCVDALVRIAAGDMDGAAQASQAFVEVSRGPCSSPDLTTGAASLLLGCAELVESAGADCPLDLSFVRNRGDEIARALSDILESHQIATSTQIRFLGIAHGWAGLVFALLRWARATRVTPSALLVTKLDEIAELAISHEGGVCWTMESKSASFMAGWCHGTAGYTMLFALAYELTGDPSHAELVEGAAASAWSIETEHASLCCGDGGNGYAFLAAYRLTGDRKWLTRARSAARRALRDDSKEFPDSLYKGELGVMLLADELDRPASAAMPLFEPVRFNDKLAK